MSLLGVFCDGVKWGVPGEGGDECRSYSPILQRIIETVFFTTLYSLVLVWCVPKLRLPIARCYSNKKNAVHAFITVLHCFIFGVEIIYKVFSRSLLFIFNPCHVLTAVQVCCTYFINKRNIYSHKLALSNATYFIITQFNRCAHDLIRDLTLPSHTLYESVS